jgi:hypothetical protein
VVGLASAAESPDKERAELAKALAGAKVSLGTGIAAATTVGKPISSKFEAEDGKLQLSVYTEKDGKLLATTHLGRRGLPSSAEPSAT